MNLLEHYVFEGSELFGGSGLWLGTGTCMTSEKVLTKIETQVCVCVCLKVCPTCVWFPQMRGPGFVAAAEASSLLSRQRVSCPPFRLFWVRVAPLAARPAWLALTRGLRVVTRLPALRYFHPLLSRRLSPGFLSLLLPLLPLLQRLPLQRRAGHGRVRLREGSGGLVVGVVGRAGVEE